MSIKIGTADIPAPVGSASPPSPSKVEQGANQTAAASAQTTATKSTRSAGVAVTVSTLARGMEKAGRGEAADIDANKVATVKAAIQGGTYVVNAEAIADKLLSNAQEMLNRNVG